MRFKPRFSAVPQRFYRQMAAVVLRKAAGGLRLRQLHWLPVQHRTDYKVNVCVDTQDSEHVCTTVPQPTHQPPRQRTDTTLDGYATAHPTVRSHRLRETFFLMRRAAPSVWNSLPASVIESDSLCVFKSRLTTFLFRESYN